MGDRLGIPGADGIFFLALSFFIPIFIPKVHLDMGVNFLAGRPLGFGPGKGQRVSLYSVAHVAGHCCESSCVEEKEK